METILIARGKELKMALPAAEIKSDGTIWQHGVPLLGITDPDVKEKAMIAVKAKRFADIPAELFTRLGDNANGLWAGTKDEWQKRPEKLEADADLEAKRAEEAKVVRIYLSSRGWGDFSPCEWRGDITRPDSEILAECRKALETGHDVDKPNQTDEQLLDLIKTARDKWEGAPARRAAAEKAYQEDIQRKIDSGFCFACETWCHGDCGNYSNDPRLQLRRELKTAQAEENYGISEGA